MSASLPRVLQRWLAGALICLGTGAVAAPWIDAGDSAMRADLQLLSDHGVITSPGQTWPRPWPEIARDVARTDRDDLPAHVLAALARVRAAAMRATDDSDIDISATVGTARSATRLRTFEHTPREQLEGNVSVEAMRGRVAGRLSLTGALGPEDGQSMRLDGSYGSVLLGNWIVTAGWQDRWWGPGHDGSLILSNNARPPPMLAIDRNHADAFESPWLSWIGPWRFGFTYGVLDDDGTPSNPHFFTFRATARPFESLELGLSRTAIWCGDDRPCSLDALGDVVIGNESDSEIASNPGNQLASLEFRWRLPPAWVPVAVYGMLLGEDSISPNGKPDLKDYLPKRQLVQLGAEAWGGVGDVSVRGHLEYADTVCRYSVPDPDFGCAYEHHIYTDGYRYRGRVLGHSLEGDGRMYSAGVTVMDGHGDPWTAVLRSVEVNMAGESRGNTVSAVPLEFYNLELTHTRELNLGTFEFGVGYDHVHEGEADDRVRAHAAFTIEF